MKTVQATELKARLSAILGDVERGETVAIQRHGKIVGRLVPANDSEFWERRRKAVDAIQALKTGRPTGMTVEDIPLGSRRRPKAALTIVIDSSTAASWSIPDEQSLAAAKALAASRSDYVLVPSLFWHEFRNVLLVAQRRNRLTASELEAAIMAVSALSPLVDDLDDNFAVLLLAQRHNLTAYDAAYLELALREKAILATLDRRLAEAGRIERLTVLCDH